jgi:hypothetical protein
MPGTLPATAHCDVTHHQSSKKVEHSFSGSHVEVRAGASAFCGLLLAIKLLLLP